MSMSSSFVTRIILNMARHGDPVNSAFKCASLALEDELGKIPEGNFAETLRRDASLRYRTVLEAVRNEAVCKRLPMEISNHNITAIVKGTTLIVHGLDIRTVFIPIDVRVSVFDRNEDETEFYEDTNAALTHGSPLFLRNAPPDPIFLRAKFFAPSSNGPVLAGSADVEIRRIR